MAGPSLLALGHALGLSVAVLEQSRVVVGVVAVAVPREVRLLRRRRTPHATGGVAREHQEAERDVLLLLLERAQHRRRRRGGRRRHAHGPAPPPGRRGHPSHRRRHQRFHRRRLHLLFLLLLLLLLLRLRLRLRLRGEGVLLLSKQVHVVVGLVVLIVIPGGAGRMALHVAEQRSPRREQLAALPAGPLRASVAALVLLLVGEVGQPARLLGVLPEPVADGAIGAGAAAVGGGAPDQLVVGLRKRLAERDVGAHVAAQRAAAREALPAHFAPV
uniref:Uncharacterized protein n=1 Tax=Triticum urartu TaxID=4572 RepID=A0A8R7PCI5_TRIUA